MDSSLDLLQRSNPSLSLGSALSLILLAIAFIGVVKRGLRKRFPPGPSGWPVIGSLPLLRNMPHRSLYQLSKQYGPIMYLKLGTTDTVVVSSPKIAEACLKTNDLNFSNRPANSSAKYIGYDSNGLVWAPYGPRWRTMRKICNIHLFGGKALDDLQPVREEEVGMLVKCILEHERQGKAVNLGEVLNICAANVLGQIMLSKRMFDFQGRSADEFRQLVVEQTDLAGKFIIGDFVPSLAWMDTQGVRTKMKKLHIRVDEFISKMIEEHQTASCNGAKADFLSILLPLRNDAESEEGKLTSDEIKGLLLTMFNAGTDTSSITVEWAIAELIRHPNIMKRCQEEIESAVKGEERKVKESDLRNLPYLQAVVKETLRLHPSVPLLLPRMTVEACEIEGYYIPKNARLMVNAWGMQRDPGVWERPLEFDPGRFIGSSVDVRGSDFQLIPFGAGRRICAGMSMGIRMVQLMLATLVHSFDLSLPHGQPPEATILPVFYNVKHSDLRYGGAYAKALDKQEEQKRYDRQTIQKWKDALNDVPVQAGFELQACKGGEVELLRKVVQGVLNIVPKPQFDVAKYPTGLERKLRDFERNVLSQQEEEPREARVVGIIGPGGVGKTTFVQYFFNSKASEYDKSSLLLNVKAHGESLNILQGRLITDLKDLKIKINRDQGIAVLKRHLLYCHALIILDDVDSIAQLDAFLQIKDVLDPKSLIVVTSRNRHVLESANFAQSSIYRLTGLDEFQSKELFCRHAFGDRPHPPDEFEILVKRVLKVCDGMPLSLTVLGAHLCNQDKLDWEDQLQGLPQTLPTQIKDSLLISYNSLTHQEKQIFLDIAIYAVGKDKDTWIRIWRESGWSGRVAFKNLWKKCLVEVDGENRIRMHDNLIDLGKSICSDSGRPESVPLRLWDVTVKDINDLLLKQRNHHQSSPEQVIRGIRMAPQSGDEEQLRLKSQTQLAGIKELQLLQAEGYFAEHLLTRMQPTNLIWFSWNNCPLLSLPPSILLQGLKVLEVAGGKLERLWESNTQACLQLQELNIDAPFLEFPRALGPIKQLEKIVVEYSVDEGAHLTTLPEELGTELSCLKHLKFKRCFRLQSIPESLGNLTKLQHIDLSGCKSLQKLPDSLGKLINLQNMKLSDCECLNELPDCLENLVNLRHINLSGCKSLKEFPDSLENFRELQHLDLSKCERLELLPNSFRNLTKLQYINLSECKSLAEVPSTFGNLTDLRHVDLSRCESLGALPDCFDNLKRIEHFDLSGCESLDGLPDSFKHLRNLQHISLSGCKFLKELPDCISRNLQHINLSGCKRLTKLPDSFDFLTHIQDINLSCCINLNELPNSFVNLIHLQHLNLERCESLKTLPDLFGKLSNLQHINLKQCKSLKKLPDSFGMLTNLQYIDLQRCSMLEMLPDSFGNLINLKTINLFSCESLKMIPNSFGNLVQLRRVDLRDCCSLTVSSEPLRTVAELYLGNNLTHELPSDVGCLRKLETLLIEDPLMEGFPPSLDELTNLQELLLVECQKLQCLPESVGRLAQLRLLEIRNCGIRSLPRDLMKLNNLKRLEVTNCPLHQLPFTKVEGERETTEGQIASNDLDASLDTGILKLEELHLELIEISEVSFPPRVCPRLRLLEIKSCNGIVEVGALPTTLRTLVLKRCGALRKIGGLSGLANLESVDMTDCNNIEAKESPGFETLMKSSKVVGRPLHTQVGQEEELRCLEIVTLILEVTRRWINSCTEGFCHLFRPS